MFWNKRGRTGFLLGIVFVWKNNRIPEIWRDNKPNWELFTLVTSPCSQKVLCLAVFLKAHSVFSVTKKKAFPRHLRGRKSSPLILCRTIFVKSFQLSPKWTISKGSIFYPSKQKEFLLHLLQKTVIRSLANTHESNENQSRTFVSSFSNKGFLLFLWVLIQ